MIFGAWLLDHVGLRKGEAACRDTSVWFVQFRFETGWSKQRRCVFYFITVPAVLGFCCQYRDILGSQRHYFGTVMWNPNTRGQRATFGDTLASRKTHFKPKVNRQHDGQTCGSFTRSGRPVFETHVNAWRRFQHRDSGRHIRCAGAVFVTKGPVLVKSCCPVATKCCSQTSEWRVPCGSGRFSTNKWTRDREANEKQVEWAGSWLATLRGLLLYKIRGWLVLQVQCEFSTFLRMMIVTG